MPSRVLARLGHDDGDLGAGGVEAENATHWPSRTPSTRETTRSMSCG
jgi:hypothetical protein